MKQNILKQICFLQKQLIQHKSIFYFTQKNSQDDLIRISEMIGTFIMNEKSLLHFIYRPIMTIQF